MRRTEQVQGLRLMKFEEVYGRTHRGGLSQAEAAEVLGVSERTFRRWRDRYEAEGADGLYDRRLGRLSARRAPVDEVARVLELFDTRYWDFTAKHFHEKLVADHGFKRSYNWLRLSLQAHGRRRAAPRRGAHRRKRPRRALPGMMLHQDGSSHEWVPGRWWDLIVTMDDATSDIYSAVNAGLKLLHSPERKYLSLTGIGLSIDPHSGVPPNSDAVVRGCGQTGGRCLGFRLCLTVGCV